ncbi:MAG: polysaccharide biosynthesis/export family protein [Planctomycetales bacterium]|nr:polysaccharide biosynthesis/export family protein [Planctomycetales bacterium]
MVRNRYHLVRALLMMACLSSLSGCTIYRHTVPGYCVGAGYQESRSNKDPINFLTLRRDPPDAYRLDERDVLGIYIEGVVGSKEEPPPVHFPEDGNTPPAIGYPFPIRENGTISLPLIEAIDVRGLTLAQAEQKIRESYIDKDILKKDKDRIIVTLMRPRTYHVLVVREDESLLDLQGRDPQRMATALALGTSKRGMSHAVELKAYENDVLHALSETGGLPGNDAKNEVIILRGAFNNPEQRDYFMSCMNDPDSRAEMVNQPNVVRIPLRIGPNDPVMNISQRDIILNSGDIVFVQSRETEVFYTGGLLPGGQYPLPRDYDIDVLQAMAMAGGSVSSATGATESAFLRGGAGAGAIFPATRVIVLRELCGEQVPIEVNLKRAMVDPSERVIVQPGDFIILEYTPMELFGNIMVSNIRLNYFLNNIGN